MAALEDTDLVLVNRNDQTFTMTGAELKASMAGVGTLGGLSDVDTSNPNLASGMSLIYNADTAMWEANYAPVPQFTVKGGIEIDDPVGQFTYYVFRESGPLTVLGAKGNMEVLLVGGGGRGGNGNGSNAGGGGGAGGCYVAELLSVKPGNYTVEVGAANNDTALIDEGGNDLGRAIAGGNGSGNSQRAQDGGSGGGEGGGSGGGSNAAGTAGQGNQGGSAGGDTRPYNAGGGGGKAGAGGNYTGGGAGGGGAATNEFAAWLEATGNVDGVDGYIAGGGGGGGGDDIYTDRYDNGAGGGGGGAGRGGNSQKNSGQRSGEDALPNSGSGGGGAGSGNAQGGAGGSGLCIVRVPYPVED